MYLPSFYKVKFEKYFATTKRFAPFGIVAIAWVTWTLWPQLYNTIYTDFIPPARGVQRRVIEDV